MKELFSATPKLGEFYARIAGLAGVKKADFEGVLRRLLNDRFFFKVRHAPPTLRLRSLNGSTLCIGAATRIITAKGASVTESGLSPLQLAILGWFSGISVLIW